VVVQRAAIWQEDRDPLPANAEALGKLLRERLRSAGIAPAPVLVCIGRDRLILKEVLYPAVPEHEEPAVVRFQAAKELTDAAEDAVIDYTTGGEPGPNGERRALALVAPRELVHTYQSLCRAAGLKLLALTPRPFGSLACLQEVIGTTGLTPPPDPPTGTVAVLTLTDRWAEFCVGRGEQLLLTRSMALGNTLAGEVRRNVSVFNGQSGDRPVRAVYVAGSGEHAALCERLEHMLEIRVYLMDPFAGVDRPELPQGQRGGFAGVVGLAHLHATGKKLPINFVHPKQPRPPSDPNQKRLLAVAALAAAVLLAVFSLCYTKLSAKEDEVAQLAVKRASLDRELATLDDDAKRIKNIEDWNRAGVVWLDELYDLTEGFPDTNSIRLTQLVCEVNNSAKDKKAQMSITGITTDNPEAADALQRSLVEESEYYGVGARQTVRNRGVEAGRFREQFSIKVGIEKRPREKYTRKLIPAAERGGDFAGFGDGGQQ
jgi:Tfp pilus assembly PilM family ATPase